MGGMVVGAIAGDALGAVGTAVVGDALTGAVVSGVTGGNPLEGALLGGIGGGISNALGGVSFGSAGGAGTSSAVSMSAGDIQNLANSSGWDLSTADGLSQAAQSLGVSTGDLSSALSSNGMLTATGNAGVGAGGALSNISASGLGNAFKSNTGSLSALGNLGSAILQSNASGNAAQQVAAAAANANQEQLAMYNENVALQAPYRAAGNTALGQITAGTQPGGQFNTPFTMSMAQNMPAYQFAEQQGQGAINNAATAGGTSLSSANLQNLAQFNAGNAAQYENQAFNQWLSQNNQTLGALQSQAGLGQSATNSTQTAGQNLATATNNNLLTSGNAQAAGTLAQTQPYVNAISNIGNTGMAQYTLNSLLNSSA